MEKDKLSKRVSRRIKIEYTKLVYAKNDKKYLENMYEILIGEKPDFDNPKTFNEKLNWLKLNWYNPLVETCVDKYKVREYIESKGLNQILVELYGVYESTREIDINNLPEKFIIKTNHGSGNAYICTNKSNFNEKKIFGKLEKELKQNIYSIWKEWPYKNIAPKIVIEELLEEPNNETIADYKFFCFNGEPRFLYVASDRQNELKFDFYDLDWNHLPVTQGYPNSAGIEKPEGLQKMIDISRILCKDFPQVRVDLYYVQNKIYFGELTFFHFAGLKAYSPKEYDVIFGDYFDMSSLIEKNS